MPQLGHDKGEAKIYISMHDKEQRFLSVIFLNYVYAHIFIYVFPVIPV